MKRYTSIYIYLLFCLNLLKAQGTYIGSGSVTQGLGITTTANLMPSCPSNHVTPVGKILSTDKKEWIVPAETNFLTGASASDMHNACNKFEPTSLSGVNLNSVPVKVIDADGEVITGFIFCDNYFELYINGTLVGVDPVPFTPFNSCVVKFRVSKPYTIAVKMVDWEENVGLGSEIQSPSVLYHPGDGGFIAQFSDGTITDASWKTQTFYIAPIQNLSSVVEQPNGTRSSATATTNPTCNANCYGIHYEIPTDWNAVGFNDSGWPSAVLYTAAQVTNSTAYTNFATSAWPKAKFIWSSNLILDNLVLTRKTVPKATSSSDSRPQSKIEMHYNPANGININAEEEISDAQVSLTDINGKLLQQWSTVFIPAKISTNLQPEAALNTGAYFITIDSKNAHFVEKMMVLK
jgi:hypothetical protein